ncbi:DHHA1 domain-containing protein, partial [Lachnospiraceae bacterium OttesenSCG-928-D06]|nr:DHHA1 domain-containing protein [Lachnospiraceae bacterium OttesenSCG-928-D06]
QAAMEKQRETARIARKTTNYMGADITVYESIDKSITSEFVGYDSLSHDSKILVLTTDSEITNALTDGEYGTIIVEQTPFYGTKGGQVGDIGVISSEEGSFSVKETIVLSGGKIGHIGCVTKGMLKTGDTVNLLVDRGRRTATCKNHSATHLLQRALREVLGTHVEQAGSLVDDKKLRFDFSHFAAMTKEEIEKTEKLVNEKIMENLLVETNVMTIDDAKKTGAMALFDEKYGEEVRVVKMDDFSVELCGGTHVANTGVITVFKIIAESGIAAGIRRIEALTGSGVFSYYQEKEEMLNEAAKIMKVQPDSLSEKCEQVLSELKALHAENESMKSKAAKDALGDVMNQVIDCNGIKLLAANVDDVDMNGLRDLGDSLKDKIGEGVVVLLSKQGDKVNLIVMATNEAITKGAHAGNLIKQIAPLVGGGGGGRPNMAQAGGKNPEGIPSAIAKVKELLLEQIS